LEKKFGQSSVFVASTLLENGGTLKSASPASLLKEAIHVISCGYEDKTDWGKDVSVAASILVLFVYWFSGRNICYFQFLFCCRLAGSMVQLQKIFLLGLRCTAMVGGQSIAYLNGLHSKVLHLSIFLIVFTRFFGGLLGQSKFSSAIIALFGMAMVVD
jgi:hypothetical protein